MIPNHTAKYVTSNFLHFIKRGKREKQNTQQYKNIDKHIWNIDKIYCCNNLPTLNIVNSIQIESV